MSRIAVVKVQILGNFVNFQIVYGDRDIVLPLMLDSEAEEHLVNFLSAHDANSRERQELSKRLATAISASLEKLDFPPTDKQIKYAIAIAQELSIQIPAEVLQYRDSMGAFLNRHAEAYRSRKNLISK